MKKIVIWVILLAASALTAFYENKESFFGKLIPCMNDNPMTSFPCYWAFGLMIIYLASMLAIFSFIMIVMLLIEKIRISRK
jgi:hypothetical protein